MTAKHATRDALLAYIRADSEPRVRIQIIRYMFRTYSTSPAAARQQLYMLCRAGVLEETEPGRYRIVAAGA